MASFRKDTIIRLNNFEKENDVWSIKYKGIPVWPVLRAFYHQKKVIKERTDKKKDFFFRVKSNFQLICSIFFTWIFSKKKLTKSNYLIVSCTSFRQEKISGKHLNKFTFGFQESSLKNNCQLLEYTGTYFFNWPRYDNGFSLDFLFIFSFFRNRLNEKKSKKGSEILNRDILRKFFQTSPYLELSFKEVKNRMERILFFKEVFSEVLVKTKPKVVFCIAFYSMKSMGLALACHNLGVKIVEVQHGQQGDFHICYSNWVGFPKSGTTLFPNYFWVWGKQSKLRISDWVCNSVLHETIIGGNPWLVFYLNNLKKVKIKSSSSKPKILLCTQFLKDFEESFILDIIKGSYLDVEWLIRLHPLNRKHFKTIKSRHFKDCNNVEFRNTNNDKLYDVFERADFCVTFWSTTAYEANAIGLKCIIIHPEGLDSMSEYIESGVFKYADNKDDFVNYVLNFDSVTPKSNYIETSEIVFEDAISKIIDEKITK